MVTLGYRRKFSDRLALLVTAQDVLDSGRITQTLQAPDFSERVERRFGARALFIGLSYALGGGKPKDEAFDYQP